ncbi:MAG: hypothetical protein AB9915_03450 [Candidatus Dojkabacteria bacterium]
MMNNILIYTFRTFPWVEELKDISNDIVILNKLNEDIYKIEEKLQKKKYSLILGIAKGNKRSMFETRGVNRFNKKKIIKDGKELYKLDYPKEGFKEIVVNKSFTTSFCNWAAYRIGDILEDNGLETKHTFVHILNKDLQTLNEYIKELRSS